jgi:hypothetical protein
VAERHLCTEPGCRRPASRGPFANRCEACWAGACTEVRDALQAIADRLNEKRKRTKKETKRG